MEAFVEREAEPTLVQPAKEQVEQDREQNFNIHAGESYRKWRQTGEVSKDLFAKDQPPESPAVDENDVETRVARLNDKERHEWQLTGKLPPQKAPAEEKRVEGAQAAGDGASEREPDPQDHTARYLAMPNRLQGLIAKDQELQRIHLQAAGLPKVVLPDAIRPAVEVFRHAFADLKNPDMVYRHLAVTEPQMVDQIYAALQRGEQGARVVIQTLRMLDAELPKAMNLRPAKTVTSAPPPPTEVGGRGSASVDAATQAVNEGDFAAYQRAMNARDTAPMRAARERRNRRGGK